MELELRHVVSRGELPGVLQAEANCAGVTLGRGDETAERAAGQPHRAVVDLEASDWERSKVEEEACASRLFDNSGCAVSFYNSEQVKIIH